MSVPVPDPGLVPEPDDQLKEIYGPPLPENMSFGLCPRISFAESQRATKVIATFGPGPDRELADETREERMREIITAGANVIRLNFSHGSHEDHLKNIQAVRKISAEIGKPVAILADLQGPKTRLSEIPGGNIDLVEDQTFTLKYGNSSEDDPWHDTVYTKAFDPAKELQVGEQIFLADASIKARVTGVNDDGVEVTVEEGGQLRSKVGIAVPDTELKAPILSKKDIEDLYFALDNGVDYIAQSFVGKAEDILDLKAHMRSHGREVPVIAKIERKKAIENLDEITAVSDGLMVARGDLGVDIPDEEVPAVQEQIIQTALVAGIPVITATEMLQSMITNSRPTRAEVADVGGAVRDGTWGVMLSQETAIGEHAAESVRKMGSIASRNEHRFDVQAFRDRMLESAQAMNDRAESLVAANCSPFMLTTADAIIVASGSGNTSRLVAKYMPDIPVFGVSNTQEGLNRMALYRGVTPVAIPIMNSHEEELDRVSNLIARAFFEQHPEAEVFRPIVMHGHFQNGTEIPPGVSFPELKREDFYDA